jgi:predicted nucleic acid-binding Zn ribbon protein
MDNGKISSSKVFGELEIGVIFRYEQGKCDVTVNLMKTVHGSSLSKALELDARVRKLLEDDPQLKKIEYI